VLTAVQLPAVCAFIHAFGCSRIEGGLRRRVYRQGVNNVTGQAGIHRGPVPAAVRALNTPPPVLA